MHDHHQDQKRQQINRKQGYRETTGNQAEQRRHETVAEIGAGHLNADHRLGPLRAEVAGGRVDQAGVDRRAAQPNQNQPRQGGIFPQRQQQGGDAEANDPLPHANQLRVTQL